jgi:hypothetical protein
MKRSIQLLIGLLFLIVAGLFFAKHSLKAEYNSIDTSNPYFSFNTIENLQFSHIKINGGNRNHVIVESGEQNKLLIDRSMGDLLAFRAESDTLYLDFDQNQTITNGSENQGGSPSQSVAYVQIKSIQSITGTNASIGIEIGETHHFESFISGNTNLEIISGGQKLKSVQIVSQGGSKFRFNKSGEILPLDFIGLNLSEESLAELYNIAPDSTFLELDPNSRISADATFFKQ